MTGQCHGVPSLLLTHILIRGQRTRHRTSGNVTVRVKLTVILNVIMRGTRAIRVITPLNGNHIVRTRRSELLP